MRQSRESQFDLNSPPWLHCISRCVRRAFLCGEGFEHRKVWLERRLRLLSQYCSVQVGAYAIMSNHLHVVARPIPEGTAAWSAEEVVLQWWLIKHDIDRNDSSQDDQRPHPDYVQQLAQDEHFVNRWRERLGSISWFMKFLKEPLSRRANREDGCTGAFWEGRFKSVPLLDLTALVTCMVYVDLNPIRAKCAETPETSDHTSVKERIEQRQARSQAKVHKNRGNTPQAKNILQEARVFDDSTTKVVESPVTKKSQVSRCGTYHSDPEMASPSWLTPVCQMTREQGESEGIASDVYLNLVDVTARLARVGKRGCMKEDLIPLLERLSIPIEPEDWLATVAKPRGLRGVVLGAFQSVRAETKRRSQNWMQLLSPIFSNPKTFLADGV